MKKLCYIILVLIVIFSLVACSCKHETITKATCGKPANCKECGEDVGEPTNDHKWNEATCKTPKTCRICKETEGTVTDNHEWEEATCYEPKTCKVCKKTEGEKVAEHIWLPADCENPVRCDICGDTEGDSLGHTWVDATYEAPKTCTTCGKTKGSPKQKPAFLATLKNSVPLTITNYYSSGKKWNSVYLTEVRVEHETTYSGGNNIILYFSGEKTYDENGSGQSRSCSVGIKVYDTDGYVVADDTYYTHDLRVGDKFRDDKCQIYEDLPDGEYYIELLSTN